jgi:hypothetical protein
MAAVCVAVYLAFGGLGYALLAAGMLAVSLSSYLLPTWYELGATSVVVRFLGQAREIPWSTVRRVSVQRDGVYLSPAEQPSRRDRFRGVFLRFAGNADEVVSFVRSKASVGQ